MWTLCKLKPNDNGTAIKRFIQEYNEQRTLGARLAAPGRWLYASCKRESVTLTTKSIQKHTWGTAYKCEEKKNLSLS